MTNNRQISDRNAARLVAGIVGFAAGIKPEQILSAGRGTVEVSSTRQVSMYLCHVALGLSLARVANAFARDRSTVAHSCRLIEDRRDDQTYDAWIECLEDSLRAMEPLRRSVA